MCPSLYLHPPPHCVCPPTTSLCVPHPLTVSLHPPPHCAPPLQHLSDTSTLIKALKEINRSPEFNYLTQIIFMLFEDTSKDLQAEDRFRVDIHFSPGVKFRQEVFVDDSDDISSSPKELCTNCQLTNTSGSSLFVRRLSNNVPETHKETVEADKSLPERTHQNGYSNGYFNHDNSDHSDTAVNTASGLALATELASTIHPLIPICSAPLHQINDFFSSITDVCLNFDPELMTTDDSLPSTPRSTTTSEPDKKSPTRNGTQILTQVSVGNGFAFV